MWKVAQENDKKGLGMKKLSQSLLVSLLCVLLGSQAWAEDVDARGKFFETLKALDGQTFEGETDLIVGKANDEMADARLIVRFQDWGPDELRVPFQVDDNFSRTWILTRTDKGLLLKHDHRHEDGTPDEVTSYGGWATDSGTAHQQFFLADAETRELFPHADDTAGWTLELQPEEGRLLYYVSNKGEVRYRAVFDISSARATEDKP